MASVTEFARKHPVTVCFALAFLITRGGGSLLVTTDLDPFLREISPLQIALLVLVPVAPTAAAAIVTKVTGGNLLRWFRQALEWRVAPRWWLAAIGIPFAHFAITVSVQLLLGGTPSVNLLSTLWFSGSSILGFSLFHSVMQELYWRGFMLPYLQDRYSALASSVLIGILWAISIPPDDIVQPLLGGWPLEYSIHILIAISIAIVSTWLYNSTGGSVLVTAIFFGGATGAYSTYGYVGGISITRVYAPVIAWAIVVAVIIAVNGAHRLTRRDTIPTAEDAGAPPRREKGAPDQKAD